MLDILIFIVFLVLILGSGVVATNFYCRFAYNRCASCGSFNAKRRSHCRKCQSALF